MAGHDLQVSTNNNNISMLSDLVRRSDALLGSVTNNDDEYKKYANNDVRSLWLEKWNEATMEYKQKQDKDVGGETTTTMIETRLSKWFERLWELYTEKGRYYHTVIHLKEMFQLFQLITSHLTTTSTSLTTPPNDNDDHHSCAVSRSTIEKQAILLSIFFHDAIYDPKSNKNEEMSAKLFEEFVDDVTTTTTGGGEEKKEMRTTTMVTDYILCTKQHVVSDDYSFSKSLFLDIDMAVLGKERNAYQRYAGQIRMEYNHVPFDVYCKKRADVLESFLSCKWIYGTKITRDALEERARANIQDEIQSLRQGIIPGLQSPS